jgi:MerR family transcriptional regulator, repressor of the yfmOP operon
MGTTAQRGAPATAPAAGSPPAAGEPLLGIGAAAERAGVSERALRYYQQLGLLVPACTPGGLRRYSEEDLARVARIRELQTLLGLNLDEIAVVLRNEDRLAEIRLSYHDERTSDEDRRRLTRECLTLQESLRDTVKAKKAALEGFLNDLDFRIRKCRDLLLASDPEPGPGQQGAPVQDSRDHDRGKPAPLGGDRAQHG